MEPGDGYWEHDPAFMTNYTRTIQIITRKRRRSEEMRKNQEDNCVNCSTSVNRSPRWRRSNLLSSSLVLILTSIVFLLCLVPLTSCLPFGDGSRSQLDLLIDPIHQAEYDEDPLESKRIVAKSVFDMVLRTPPPPTTSSNRCPPGTQSPFEGGPCIKKSTEPVATLDQVFLLEQLRDLTKQGAILQGGGGRTKRPGSGKRRPGSGRPGSRPKTTYEPATSTTTQAPVIMDEGSSDEPPSTILTTGDINVEEGITVTQTQPPPLPPSSSISTDSVSESPIMIQDNNNININDPIRIPILPSVEYKETTIKNEIIGSTLPPNEEEDVTSLPSLADESFRVPEEDVDASPIPSELQASQVQSGNEEIVKEEEKPATAAAITSLPTPTLIDDEQIIPTSGDDQSMTTTQDIMASYPVEGVSSNSLGQEQEKSGQLFIDKAEATTIEAEKVLPESVALEEAKIPEPVQILRPPTPSLQDVTTFTTKQDLKMAMTGSSSSDVIAKDKEDNMRHPSSSSPTAQITPPVMMLITRSPPAQGQVVEREDEAGVGVTVDMFPENKDDIIIMTTSEPVTSPSAHSHTRRRGGDIDKLEADFPTGPDDDDSLANFMTTRMIRYDQDKKPVPIQLQFQTLNQNLDQGEPKTTSTATSASKITVEEMPNEPKGGESETQLILEEKVTTPSTSSTSPLSEESKRDKEQEEKRVLLLITKEGPEPKRAPEKQQQVQNQQQPGTTETTSLIQEDIVTGSSGIGTGSKIREEAEVEAGPQDDHHQDDDDDDDKGVIEEEGDSLPSFETTVVNHLDKEQNDSITNTPVEHEKIENMSDLLIVNNGSISPGPADVIVKTNKDGERETIKESPNFIVEENSSSSRERMEVEQNVEARGKDKDEPVLQDPVSTTLLPPPPPPSKDAPGSTLLQFQLPIVTQGPGSRDEENENGFVKFPEFPVPLPLKNENPGKIRFPTGEENLVPVPAEGNPSIRATFRPVLVEDFQVEPIQEWQSPKPFPQAQEQSSSPAPVPKDPIQIQTSLPEYYDTGSTEYLESELDRRHQKTRSRNRLRYPDHPSSPSSFQTTNAPNLVPELVFYHPHNSQQQVPSLASKLLFQHQLSPPRQFQQRNDNNNEQAYLFARRNPSSSDFFPFGYLNLRSGNNDNSRFGSYSRRLFR